MIISDDDDNIDSDHFALITLADRHCLRGSNFVLHVTLFSVPLNFCQEEQGSWGKGKPVKKNSV